jgi:hypothetical protein
VKTVENDKRWQVIMAITVNSRIHGKIKGQRVIVDEHSGRP